MTKETTGNVGIRSSDPINDLLASLVDGEEIRLVRKNDGATAELRGRVTLRAEP